MLLTPNFINNLHYHPSRQQPYINSTVEWHLDSDFNSKVWIKVIYVNRASFYPSWQNYETT